MNPLLMGIEYTITMAVSSIWGSSITGTVAAVLDYQTAMAFGNINTLHALALPQLPAGTNKDPSVYTYYLINDGSSTRKVISEAWISGNPTQVNSITIEALIQNVTALDILKIQNILLDNGYNSIAVNQV